MGKKTKHWTTWEGMVEWSMDASTTKKLTCIAKSENGARKELERLAKKKHDSYLSITNVKVSE